MSTRAAIQPAAAVLAAAVVVGLAACGPARTTAPAAAPTGSATAPVTASVAPPASPRGSGMAYRAVGNLCTATDVSALEPQVGKAEPKPVARFDRTDSGVILSCTIRMGSLGNAGAVIVLAYMYDDHSAQQAFQMLRELENYPSTAVPGLGAEAYSYLDTGNRPHVAAYDANLQLSVLYVPTRPLNNPRDLFPPLVQVCEATIALLQRHSAPSAAGTGLRRPA